MLHRRFFTPNGEEISLNDGSIQLGDLIHIQIEIVNKSNEHIQNIALVDRIPAGWEIENPRLGRGQSLEWYDEEDRWTTDYMNLRDDRLELFGNLNPRERRSWVYAVRAVTSGEFTLPPVEAEAMYDPQIWARQAGKNVVIQGPWAAFLN